MSMRVATVLAMALTLYSVDVGHAATKSEPTIEVNVTLNRDSIGLDEQAILAVTISGPNQNLPAPDMPTMSMFEVYSQGRSSNVSIVNGKVSASVIYRYMILPKKVGTFPIDLIGVVHNNKRYRGNKVELTVLPGGKAPPKQTQKSTVQGDEKIKDYLLEAIVDNPNPYVNEQVTLTLKFYIAVQYYGSPQLTEPTTTGFWTEVLGNKTPYYQRLQGRRFKVIERKYALFPTQTGNLTVGRAAIRTTVATRRRRRTDPFDVFDSFFGRGEEVTIRSRPVEIKVKALPTVGRPDDFTGTIGQFNIEAAMDKREVEVNQPVTLTIRISGIGNIKSVAEPEMPDLPDFRIYRASSSENTSKQKDKLGGTKVYEEVFIPNKPGQHQVPTISFSYFDPVSRKYKRSRTKPIKLNVSQPEGYIAGVDNPYIVPDLTIGSQARDIRYIKEDIGDLVPVGHLLVLTPLYLAANGLPVLMLAGVILFRRRRERLAGDLGYARARRAAKMARQRLTKARSLAKADTLGEFYAELHSALVSYIADKLNISPHGLTIEGVQNLLEDKSADDELIGSLTEFLRKCDFARFASSEFSEEDISLSLEQAGKIMIAMEGVRLGNE